MEINPFGLGGQSRIPDARDFHLGKIQLPVQLPAVYLPDISALPTHHQHKLPTCGANAYAWLEELCLKGSFSPRYSWIRIKQIDGFALEDGTDMLSIFKAGQSRGVCDLSVCPDDSLLELHTYSDPSALTKAMDDNAGPKVLTSYGFIMNPSFEQIRQAIYQNGGVLALLRVGEEMWTPSWKEKDILPLRAPKNIVSGHFVTFYGFDQNYIYFKNSWGTEWGRLGSGYFGQNYLPFIVEIGAVVNARKNVPTDNFPFTRDLTIGSKGIDVTALQQYLVQHNFLVMPPGVAYGYFGGLTQMALARWQTANGISPSAGYFGAKSRAFIAAH